MDAQKEIEVRWEELFGKLEGDQTRLARKFQEIEDEFKRIKQILKDSANKGLSELHRL